VEADLSDEEKLRETFEKYPIDVVMHFVASRITPKNLLTIKL
jgi:UDP-glucose 4-epimerase